MTALAKRTRAALRKLDEDFAAACGKPDASAAELAALASLAATMRADE